MLHYGVYLHHGNIGESNPSKRITSTTLGQASESFGKESKSQFEPDTGGTRRNRTAIERRREA